MVYLKKGYYMSRYRGPRVKIMRSLGVELPGLTRKSMERRPYPPGMHRGQSRRKLSVYAMQLREKQKLRMNYGVTERQLRNLFGRAKAKRGDTGVILLQLLEQRLDSVLFRSGLAPTIPAARQIIRHNHVKVNGKKVNIPSFSVQRDMQISLTEKGAKLPVVVSTIENPHMRQPEWMTVDTGATSIKINDLPTRETFPFPIETGMIVEYYSRLA